MGGDVFELLSSVDEWSSTLVVVTHDHQLAARFSRRLVHMGDDSLRIVIMKGGFAALLGLLAPVWPLAKGCQRRCLRYLQPKPKKPREVIAAPVDAEGDRVGRVEITGLVRVEPRCFGRDRFAGGGHPDP